MGHWPWKRKTPSLSPPLPVPGFECSRSSGPHPPCPPRLSPAGTGFTSTSSFPSLGWRWAGQRGAGHRGQAGFVRHAHTFLLGPAGCQEHPGEQFRILMQVEEVCPALAPGGGRSLSHPCAGWCTPEGPPELGSSQGLRPLQGRGACSPTLPRPGIQSNRGLTMGVSPRPHCPHVSSG